MPFVRAAEITVHYEFAALLGFLEAA